MAFDTCIMVFVLGCLEYIAPMQKSLVKIETYIYIWQEKLQKFKQVRIIAT